VLARPQVQMGLLMTVLGFGGVFAVFTYIQPILTELAGYLEGRRLADPAGVRRRPGLRQSGRRPLGRQEPADRPAGNPGPADRGHAGLGLRLP
jgi:hypothetical protein